MYRPQARDIAPCRTPRMRTRYFLPGTPYHLYATSPRYPPRGLDQTFMRPKILAIYSSVASAGFNESSAFALTYPDLV